jgi:mRNA-degrading endonuclease YafQ of YafQ-DinJ toxin-antitoxin module
MTIYYYPRFQRNYKTLDPKIQERVAERIALFRANPFDVRLDTHSLHGRLKKRWSFSIDSRHRVVFEFLNRRKQEVLFLDIGNHSIYR